MNSNPRFTTQQYPKHNERSSVVVNCLWKVRTLKSPSHDPAQHLSLLLTFAASINIYFGRRLQLRGLDPFHLALDPFELIVLSKLEIQVEVMANEIELHDHNSSEWYAFN